MAFSAYYRYKLTDRLKTLYDELLHGMKDMVKDVSVGSYSIQDINIVLYAVNYDNPELYYVDFKKILIRRSEKECVFILSYYCDKKSRSDIDSQLRIVVNTAIQPVIGKSMKSGALALHGNVMIFLMLRIVLLEHCYTQNVFAKGMQRHTNTLLI